jgi:hypothetical protein
MKRPRRVALFLIFIAALCALPLGAEQLRVFNAESILVSMDKPGGDSVNLSYNAAAVIALDREIRFFRGIEMEFTVPQAYLAHRGSLAMAIYADLDRTPGSGLTDLEARQLRIEPIPNKLQIIYQIPIRSNHGLRESPYAALPVGVAPPESFPLLFRILPVIKGLNEEVVAMSFKLNVKPIFSDEGAVRVLFRYPETMARRPFTILIDEEVVERPQDTRLLKEGEHSLAIISNDYRNESHRFVIERAKVLELNIALRDTIPLVYFEAPDNAVIFFDDQEVDHSRQPISAEPGSHEARFQMGDYTMIKSVTVRRGKTYRIALAVDISVSEND